MIETLTVDSSRSMSRRRNTNGKRSVQSTLQFRSTPTIVKCPKCLMTYNLNSPSDLAQHKKYHDLHLNGKKWSVSWGDMVTKIEAKKSYDSHLELIRQSEFDSGTQCGRVFNSTQNIACPTYEDDEYIVMISPGQPNEVKATLELMSIVNEELHAPQDENDFWSVVSAPDRPQGRAFVYIKKNRAVGVITIEHIENERRGKWMVLETKSIVPNVIPNVKLGISRIWVCRNQRKKGIATRLLESARKKSIFGYVVQKWELAWSQPSQSGSKLAESYNPVKHASGKILIPCYI